MSNLNAIFKKAKAATAEGEVRVDISYDIIRNVSAQLYTNPRKAIEELVCNSYDAGATECHVKLPKDQADALVVLDNGQSMDLDGLKSLWQVANSPKKPDAHGRRVDNDRLQIGKFGVGKLAAYALGKRLTHIATIKGVTRVVSVGKSEIKGRSDGSAPRFKAAAAIAQHMAGYMAGYSVPQSLFSKSRSAHCVHEPSSTVFQRTGTWIVGEHGNTAAYHLGVIKPNDRCWCRSGKKYRKCHMQQDQVFALQGR